MNHSFLDFNQIIMFIIPFVEYAIVFGFVTGFFGFFCASMHQKRHDILEWIFLTLSGFGLVSVIGWFLLFSFTQFDSYSPLFLFVAGAGAGFVLAVFGERKYLDRIEKGLHSITKKSEMERDKKTDIRKMPEMERGFDYDPEKYFKKDSWFLGLDSGTPLYYEEKTLPHVEVCGMTGCGKGVVLGVLASQCIQRKEAVFILDPKNDEWFPHVAFEASKKIGVKYTFVDLSLDEYQFNIFEDASKAEIEELLIAGFELGDKGEASDFYKIGDRKMARFISEQYKNGDTAESLYIEHAAFLGKQAEAFEGKFRELAEVTAINAKSGLSLKEVINEGGVVYVVGSMRNVKITRIQKMLLVRLIQIAEKRDRIAGGLRQVCVVLDELKYHISRTALEALGASRDKGLHMIMAHQSIADLRDCPKDLEPQAVVGAVLENTKMKIVYRVEMPETAEIFAKKSGRILVDEDTRFIERSLSLADHMKPDKHVRQTERFLVDENMFLSLPHRCCVVFGAGETKKMYTSPCVVEKKSEAVEVEINTVVYERNNNIDFDKLG
jgi:hypothetical protein